MFFFNRTRFISTGLKTKRGKKSIPGRSQCNALNFFHLEEHSSGRHLIQALQQDDFARDTIAPPGGISNSSFAEALSERGLEQFLFVFQELCKRASMLLPQTFSDLGELVAIHGTLIDSVLSMYWAEYRQSPARSSSPRATVAKDLLLAKFLMQGRPASWTGDTKAIKCLTNCSMTANISFAASKPTLRKPAWKHTPFQKAEWFFTTPRLCSDRSGWTRQ